ncbi:WD40-repeat-containing domain [Pseudocohnilembus persalinus]|uniref:WD40-repeat-containing domain n=1 Tax=Pseudocohnilembus persalinus TaxID=266149 RepID=A0A0V0QY67_PSEPJ|nr:WD40-repeat-containing domain [Pseudocohnilembus persalinus]|eukprot:KRX07273.1 WD40-repeat-containing domain [Pseudocohnilembus persalinus]
MIINEITCMCKWVEDKQQYIQHYQQIKKFDNFQICLEKMCPFKQRWHCLLCNKNVHRKHHYMNQNDFLQLVKKSIIKSPRTYLQIFEDYIKKYQVQFTDIVQDPLIQQNELDDFKIGKFQNHDLLVSGSLYPIITLYSLSSFKKIKIFSNFNEWDHNMQNTDELNMNIISPICRVYFLNKQKLLFTDMYCFIYIQNIFKHDDLKKIRHSCAVTDVAIHNEGQWSLLYYGDSKGSIGLITFDQSDSKVDIMWRKKFHYSEVFALNIIKFSINKKQQILASISTERIVLNNLQSRQVIAQYDFHKNQPIIDAEVYLNYIVFAQEGKKQYKIIHVKSEGDIQEFDKDLGIQNNKLEVNSIHMNLPEGQHEQTEAQFQQPHIAVQQSYTNKYINKYINKNNYQTNNVLSSQQFQSPQVDNQHKLQNNQQNIVPEKNHQQSNQQEQQTIKQKIQPGEDKSSIPLPKPKAILQNQQKQNLNQVQDRQNYHQIPNNDTQQINKQVFQIPQSNSLNWSPQLNTVYSQKPHINQQQYKKSADESQNQKFQIVSKYLSPEQTNIQNKTANHSLGHSKSKSKYNTNYIVKTYDPIHLEYSPYRVKLKIKEQQSELEKSKNYKELIKQQEIKIDEREEIIRVQENKIQELLKLSKFQTDAQKLEHMEASIDELNAQINQQIQQIEEKDKQIQMLTKELQYNIQMLKEVEQTHENQINENNKQYRELFEQELYDLTQKFLAERLSAQEEKNQLREHINQLETIGQKQPVTNQQLEKENTSLKNEISKLKVTYEEEEIHQLQEEMQDLKMQIAVLQDVEDKNSRLKRQINQKDLEIQQLLFNYSQNKDLDQMNHVAFLNQQVADLTMQVNSIQGAYQQNNSGFNNASQNYANQPNFMNINKINQPFQQIKQNQNSSSGMKQNGNQQLSY